MHNNYTLEISTNIMIDLTGPKGLQSCTLDRLKYAMEECLSDYYLLLTVTHFWEAQMLWEGCHWSKMPINLHGNTSENHQHNG